jgi:hypothetical protein
MNAAIFSLSSLRNTLACTLLLASLGLPHTAYAIINQGKIVADSCLTGDIRLWKPREEHTRMCLARKLSAVLPPLMEGWVEQKITWLIKRVPEDLGFRSGREIEGIFRQYGAYPVAEYKQVTGNGRVVIMASADQDQVIELQVKLDQFLLEDHKTTEQKGENMRYYIEEKDRRSPFDSKKRWFMTHISVYNTAYILIYAENLGQDRRVIYHIIDGLDPDAVKRAVEGPLMDKIPELIENQERPTEK